MTESCKTTSEMLREAPERWGALFFRFERDIYWLCDYRTEAEQDRRIAHIAEAVRNHLQYAHNWSHEAATAVGVEYAKTLKLRILRPAHFDPKALEGLRREELSQILNGRAPKSQEDESK